MTPDTASARRGPSSEKSGFTDLANNIESSTNLSHWSLVTSHSGLIIFMHTVNSGNTCPRNVSPRIPWKFLQWSPMNMMCIYEYVCIYIYKYVIYVKLIFLSLQCNFELSFTIHYSLFHFSRICLRVTHTVLYYPVLWYCPVTMEFTTLVRYYTFTVLHGWFLEIEHK